jgi:hypothetical protein
MSLSAYNLGVAQQHASITPNNSVNIGNPRRLYIGTGGDLNVTDMEGVSIIYRNVPSAFQMDLMVSKVNATNTTASNIIAQF